MAESEKPPKPDDEDPGFLVMRMRAGDTISIGTSTVSVRDVKNGNVKVAVKAPRTVPIKRIP